MFSQVSTILILIIMLIAFGGVLKANADTEANKALHRRYTEEVWNQRNLDLVDEFYATDFVGQKTRGPEGVKQVIAMFLNAFPDFQFTIEDQVAEGDMLAVRLTGTGTHQGELMGIPPTGVQITGTSINFFRIASGKIVEEWGNGDYLGMMQQMGAIPAEGNENYTWGKPSGVTGDPDDPEENKTIVRRLFEEALNQKDLSVVDEIIATDDVAHAPPNPEIRGQESVKQFYAMMLAGFPDLHFTVEDMITEGDKVATRNTATGTHQGEFMGIPPTGRQIKVTGMNIFRLASGKIVEDWSSADYLGVMQQLTAPDTEANKAIAHRVYEEVINQKNLDLVDEFYATDYISHVAGMPDVRGTEEFKQLSTMFFAAFPDLHVTIEDMIAEGDMVVTRDSSRGTHQGEFMGLPPTGKQVKWTAITIHRFDNGKFVETWMNMDFLGVMQQFGAIPPAGNENYIWGEPSEVTGDPGDPEANKAILRRVLEEVLNQKNLDLADEFYATSYVNHIPPNPEIRGPEGFKQLFAMQFAAFPDFHLTAEDIIAEGDKVVTRWTFTGTHEGELMGLPPTGKKVMVTGMVINRFADGKIVEDWENYDILGLMQQLTAPDTEANKALVRRQFEEGWNQGNLSVADEIFALDYVPHNPAIPVVIPGPEGYKQFAAMYRTVFPDIHFNVDNQIAEGDMVVTRFTITGTHQGELMGVPPTGKQVTVTGINIHRIADGKMVEGWSNTDILGMMQQLGVIPAEGDEDYTWGEPSEVTGDPGDPEENKAMLRRWVEEGLNQDNLDIIEEIYATNYVGHIPPNPEIRGSESLKQMFAMYRAGFPDYYLTIEAQIAEGDKVVQRVIFTGTHEGEFMGIPPTGKQVTWTGIVINRFADGKIVEDWESYDALGFMQQLTAPTVDTEANKVIARRVIEEVINQKNLALADELFATDHVLYIVGSPDIHGPEGFKQFFTMYFAALPDLHFSIDDVIAEGDKVIIRATILGTHQGEFMGIPPTGKQLTLTGMTINRIASGKIVESWSVYDALGMMEQIGVAPSTREDYTWGVASEVTGEPGNPEENKAILRRIVEEIINQKNLDLVDEFYPIDYVFHLPGAPEIHGAEGFKQYFATAFAAFPDFHVTIEDIFAERDKVVSRVTMRGTHKGEFMGIPPTEKQVNVTGIAIHRFADGKIVEDWENMDFMSFMQQLGVIPPPEGAEADFSNVFFMPLQAGLNLLSLPLKPITPYTARSFAAAFADLTRQSVVQSGDQLEVVVRNQVGEMVSDTLHYTVTGDAILKTFLPLTLKNIEKPRQSLLLQNYPNPFNPETWLPYQIKQPALVFIRIYNAKGQLVRTLDLGHRQAGFYLGHTRAAYWDGHNDAGEKVASGIYFYRIKAGDFSAMRKMVIMK